MKRLLISFGICLVALFLLLILLRPFFRIGHDIKERISIAQQRYPGTAEDALIAYLVDTTNSPHDRGDVAIWTLGQIHSKKALPILRGLYRNDPKGKTCHGRHDHLLCQYGIYSAIITIENHYPLVSGPELKR